MKFQCTVLALNFLFISGVIAQDDLEQRVTVLETEVVQINDDVEDVEGAVVQNTGQIFEVMNDVDDIDELNVAQDNRIVALEAENSLLRTRLDALELLFGSLNSNVQVLNDTVADLDLDEARLVALETDLTALNSSTDQRLDDLEENNGGGGVDYSHTAFLASANEDEFVVDYFIIFDVAFINPGGHYSTETGIYTVPVDGIYQFVFHYANYYLNCNGAYLEVDGESTAYMTNCDDEHSVGEMTAMLALTSGQEVYMTSNQIDEMWGSADSAMRSWFSGHLIYPL